MSLVNPSVTLLVNAAIGDGPGQHVRQRQEHQHLLALVQQRREAGLGAADLVQQVGMGQLAALGPAGGARGVDQGGRVGGLHGRQPGVEFAASTGAARLGERVERGGAGPLDAQHLAQRGQLGGELLDLVGVRVGFGEDQHRAGVLEHEPHLLGGAGLVDRHGDRAGGQDREVEDRPFVAGRREQCHPVAGLDAFGDQTQCRRTDLVRHLCAGHIRPRAVDEALRDHVVGIFALVGEHGADDVVVLADGEGSGNTELAHDAGLSTSTGGLLCLSLVGRCSAGVSCMCEACSDEQHPDRGRDVRRRRPRRGRQGRRRSRELASLVARSAADGGRGPRRGGPSLDRHRRADRHDGDLAGDRRWTASSCITSCTPNRPARRRGSWPR